MAEHRPQPITILLGLLATIACCHGSPLRCQLGVNPTDQDVENYKLCIQVRAMNSDLMFRDTSIQEELEDISRSIGGPEGHPQQVISEFDDAEIHTFPACSALPSDKCRELLTLLEDITEKLEGPLNVDIRSRRVKRSSVYYNLLHLLRTMKRGGGEDTQKLLMMYHQWRSENGYGQSRGRWGRSVKDTESRDKKVSLQAKRNARRLGKVLTALGAKSQSQDSQNIRTRRDVNGGDLGDEVYSILEQYRQWREEHGYGKFRGRWGR